MNILNMKEFEDFIALLAKDRAWNVQRWLNSTFRRWLYNADMMKSPVVVVGRRFPWNLLYLINYRFVMVKGADRVEDSFAIEYPYRRLPAWGKRAYDNGEKLHWFLCPQSAWDYARYLTPEGSAFDHWLDYLETLPNREIRMSVPQVATAVDMWDNEHLDEKAENIRKATPMSQDGCEYTWSHEKSGLQFWRLVSQAAYEHESVKMSHCVRGYYGKTESTIVSVRDMKKKEIVATLEIRLKNDGGRPVQLRKTIVQIRGPFNQQVESEVMACIQYFAAAHGARIEDPFGVTFDLQGHQIRMADRILAINRELGFGPGSLTDPRNAGYGRTGEVVPPNEEFISYLERIGQSESRIHRVGEPRRPPVRVTVVNERPSRPFRADWRQLPTDDRTGGDDTV
jgi:PcfJ-like protein